MSSPPPETYEPFADLSLWGPRVFCPIALLALHLDAGSIPAARVLFWAIVVLIAVYEVAVHVYWAARKAIWHQRVTVAAKVCDRFVTMRGAKDKLIVEFEADGTRHKTSMYVGPKLFHRVRPGDEVQIRVATTGMLANFPAIPVGVPPLP